MLRHISALEEERDKLKERDRIYQATFDRVTDSLKSERPKDDATKGVFTGLSIVIAYYDIPRQIERTLISCSPDYQGVSDGDIEVIIIDNGSNEPLPADLQARFPFVSQIIRVDGHPSPVFGLNQGIEAARHEMIALMIDGAHMLSPGIVRNSGEVYERFQNPVINVPQYILGAESQNLTLASDAFERETEDLKALGWPADGYRLFEYAVYPGENYRRSFVDAIETNCLITTRKVFQENGGFDERYSEPGAGFANLEIFSRLIHEQDNCYIILSGEGTFHQDHSGVTTQKSPEDRNVLVAEYKNRHAEVTGSQAIVNARSPILYGKTRRMTQRVPTISTEFGKASNKVLSQLADVYISRIRAGITEKYEPTLTVGLVPDERRARPHLAPLGLLSEAARRNGVEEKKLSYLNCLRQVHRHVRPESYFEIGVDTGASLSLANCPSVGVDPAFTLSNQIKAPARLYRETSDDFFANTDRCKALFPQGIDLAFIDGMHLAEYVVRDFIETEKWMGRDGVILIDDVLPDKIEMLERDRRFNAWCGDVYKIVPILRRYRPDLSVSVFETFVGPYRKGLAVVSGLDPNNTKLRRHYKEIEAGVLGNTYDVASIEALDKVMKPEPIAGLGAATGRRPVRNLAACLADGPVADTATGSEVPTTPRLSVVVIAHEMAREIPRTLRTLSARMQKDISTDDYEIIIVDNGSTDTSGFASWVETTPNARVISLPAGNVSPCHAVNIGLAAAKADQIGVFIDGARMASPGMLSRALDQLNTDPNAIVGTFGFHLGHEVQADAVQSGYDASAEDALLENSGWEDDGYRLFDVSVFAKSSGKGWKVLPSEANAVFMHKKLWIELDGFEERFRSPGGGLANLDLWKRACEKPGVTIHMLLGEGTFHQIHGGVSSNAPVSKRPAFDAEYETIRKAPYRRPDVPANFVGSERETAKPVL